MTFDNRATSDLTESALANAIVEIARHTTRAGDQISFSARYMLRPPWMTDEQFEVARKLAIEAMTPELRERYGC